MRNPALGPYLRQGQAVHVAHQGVGRLCWASEVWFFELKQPDSSGLFVRIRLDRISEPGHRISNTVPPLVLLWHSVKPLCYRQAAGGIIFSQSRDGF